MMAAADNHHHHLGRRIVILDSSNDDNSDDACLSDDSSTRVISPAAASVSAATTKPSDPNNNNNMKPTPKVAASSRKKQQQHFPRLSDSSSSLEGYIKSMRIANGNVFSDDDEEDDGSLGNKNKNNKPSSDKNGSGNENDNNSSSEEKENAWAFDPQNREYYLSQQKTISSSSTTSAINNNIVVWPKLRLPSNLYRQLYSFQKIGVQWAASLHEGLAGGCLGDDMGMGKTFTTLTLLGGLMRAGTIHNALVVAPLSVLRTWEKEANKILRQCCSDVHIIVLSSEIPTVRRQFILRDALKHKRGSKYLIITTYGLVRSSHSDFTRRGRSFFDYIVLDEGHQIKNSNAAVSQRCREICGPSTRRLLVTGTPLMNNLMEVFCLFDFATGGKVLGDRKSFREYYAKPIEAARDKTASRGIIEHGQRKSKELQNLLKPYFLQRLKIDYLKDKLPPKHECVVWAHLSETQRQLYGNFIDRGAVVKEIMRGEKNSPLEAITWLKKLCGHPLLVREQGGEDELEDVLEELGPEEVIAQSAKLDFLVRLVSKLRRKGHRTLIFSQSTKTLDIIEFVLQDRISLSRIDGSTKEKDRQARVDEFNSEYSDTDAMLLSTKAAGVGLTLVGADACVIYDPSWTPALDSQAVDRCYRISQTKEVHVYRLIAAGTVEEKMYEKQIEKDGIKRTIFSDDTDVQRYFDKAELRNLFKLAAPGVCDVLSKVQGEAMDWKYNKFISSLQSVVGLSRHDGFYSSSESSSASSSATTNKKINGAGTPFAGDAVAAGQGPKPMLGRAQRVLQRETNDIDNKKAPKSEKASSGKVVFDLCSDTEKENEMKPQARPSSKKDGGLDNNNNNGKQATKKSTASSQQKTLPVMFLFERVSEQERKGHPKRAMKLLLDLLEEHHDELNKTEKLQVHGRIAKIAQRLEMTMD